MDAIKISDNLIIEKPLALGPMAGVTDCAFRTLCKEEGAGLLFTEMVSAKGLTYHNQNTKDLLRTCNTENPIALQLFGSEPDVMAQAVMMVEDYPFQMIDINMGCPVPKVVKNHEGSYMMLEPENAARVVRAMKRATTKPISVKFRKGFYDGEELGVEFAKRMEDAGASLITIHGRTREQGYSGKADWNHIRKVKESVKIPVFGSGDVFKNEDIKRMREETGVDGVMIARGAMGNPWIFSGKIPSWEEKKKMIMRHAKLLIEMDGEYIGIRKMRSHVSWYTSGEKNSAKLRASLSSVQSIEELENCLNRAF